MIGLIIAENRDKFDALKFFQKKSPPTHLLQLTVLRNRFGRGFEKTSLKNPNIPRGFLIR